MIATPNSHLVLHKEPLKQNYKNRKCLIKCLVKIINLRAINGPVGWNGLYISFCLYLSPEAGIWG